MADVFVLEELAAELVTQGICRAWQTTANGLPQVIRDERYGTPEPQGKAFEDAIVGLVRTDQVPPAPLEGFLEQAVVDVIVRAYKAQDAELIGRQIRGLLNDRRQGYFLGALRIEYSYLWQGDQRLGADETSYTRRQSFVICARSLSLAGQPYA